MIVCFDSTFHNLTIWFLDFDVTRLSFDEKAIEKTKSLWFSSVAIVSFDSTFHNLIVRFLDSDVTRLSFDEKATERTNCCNFRTSWVTRFNVFELLKSAIFIKISIVDTLLVQHFFATQILIQRDIFEIKFVRLRICMRTWIALRFRKMKKIRYSEYFASTID